MQSMLKLQREPSNFTYNIMNVNEFNSFAHKCSVLQIFSSILMLSLCHSWLPCSRFLCTYPVYVLSMEPGIPWNDSNLAESCFDGPHQPLDKRVHQVQPRYDFLKKWNFSRKNQDNSYFVYCCDPCLEPSSFETWRELAALLLSCWNIQPVQ